MPTISQLPAVPTLTASDQIPISQEGAACSVSVGRLLAGTQPAILVATGSLLGRTSLGPGGPDPIEVGTGLVLEAGSLVATGADHSLFPALNALSFTDQAVISSQGTPKLLQLSQLRGLFSPGANIVIDQSGTISAKLEGSSSNGTSGYSIADLSTVATILSGDLVGISQSGVDHAITCANLIDGQTIDQVQAANDASGTDTFLVAQAGNVLVRQTLSAVWSWLSAQLPSYRLPILELTTSTTLTAADHNGVILICSQPITLTPSSTDVGSGFACTIINMSAGVVDFDSSIITSSGISGLAPGQAAALIGFTYSGGEVVYASVSASALTEPPGEVDGVAVSSESASDIVLTWTATSPSPLYYTARYRISGTTGWFTAPPVSTNGCSVTGLLSATSYDFVVSATNSAGTSTPSAMVTVVTPASLTTPGQVMSVTTCNVTNSAISLVWSSPGSGGAVTNYIVRYRVSGGTSWLTAASSLTTTSFTMVGLSPATGYDFAVSALNGTGEGLLSTIVSATTSAILAYPGQVTGLTVNGTTVNGVSLLWAAPSSGGTVSSYTVQYRVSGTTSWSPAVTGLTSASFGVTGLVAATNYDFSVYAVNATGSGTASSEVTAITSAGGSVVSVSWNVPPSGSYPHSSGVIGINAHVSPSNAAVQFGFSISTTALPTSWTTGNYVNTDLWGAYVSTPTVPGTWFAWVEGIDGSLPTVYASGFSVT